MNSEKYAVIQELPANQILIIDIYGNVQVYSESHVPKLNDIAIVNDKISKTFDVNLINGNNQDINNFDINLINQDNEKVNINDDVAAIFEAIEQGGDINAIFEENPTAAGNEAGSSLTSTGTISRSGAELLASTYFETSGLESLGLSTTQFLSLFQTLTELDALPFPIVATPIITDVDQTLPDILNNEPIGDDSSSITNEDTPISGSLVASDPDEDDLTYTIITNTENGSLDLDENGNWTYTPNEDYDGNDNAIIQVSDGNGGTDTINLSLTVRPIPEMSITGTERIDEDQDAVYIISFDKASDQDTQLRLSVLEDSATFDDLGAVTIIINGEALSLPENGIITLPEGETEIEVHIPAILDELLENTESFSVNVEPIFGLVGGGSVSTDIIDSSALPFLSVTGDESVNEGDYAFYDVSLSKEINVDATVQLEIQFNTAEHNDLETFEYKDNNGNWIDIPENGEITITAGQTNVEVRIKTTGDDIFEDQESFVLIARSIENVEGNGDVVTTIFDDGTFVDDDRPTVSITGDVNVDEGDYAFYTLSLDNVSDVDLIAKLTLSHLTTENDDLGDLQYQNSNGDWVDVPDNGEITFEAGVENINLRVKTTDDDIFENKENFSLSVEGQGDLLGEDSIVTNIFDNGTFVDDDRSTVSITGSEAIDEGDYAFYTLSIDKSSDVDLTAKLNLSNISTENNDLETLQYQNGNGDWIDVPESGEITFEAGVENINLRIKSTGDDHYEGEESFTISVEGEGDLLGEDSISTSIFDDGTFVDDDRPTVSIAGSEAIDEGDYAFYTLSLDHATDVDLIATLTLSNITTENNDLENLQYQNSNGDWVDVPDNGQIVFEAGVGNIELRIKSTGDDHYEGEESFTISVSGEGELLGSDSITTSIFDDGTFIDDDRPTVSIAGDVSVDEGVYAFYTLSIDKSSDIDLTAKLNLSNISTENNDLETLQYQNSNGDWVDVPNNGEIIFEAGVENINLRIKSSNDSIYEGEETFNISVEGQGELLGSDSISTSIFDDGTFIDDDRPTVSITGSDSIDEGDYAFYTVSIDKTSDIDSTVVLNVNHGSTEINDIETLQYQNSNGDWVDIPNNGEIVIAAGDTDISLRIKSTPDNIYEGEESFSISVEGKDHVLGNDTQTTSIFDDGSISDDDRPTVSISGDESISESGTAYYVVSLDAASELDSTVRLSLDLVTAESDDIEYFQYKNNEGDWVDVPENGEVNILAGQTDIDVRVKSTQDDVYEGEESFVVSVVGLGHVLGFDSQETSIFDDGSIDDDDRPIISIVGGGEVNEGDYALFTLNVTGEYEQDAVVKLSINNIETNALDISSFEYKDSNGNWMVIPVSGLLTLAANTDMVELRVKTTSDNVFEEDELFNVSVESISGITGNDSADATIIEPNTPPVALDINMDVYGSEQVPFADYVSDYEDDHDPNDIVSIRIESEPEYGILYYMDEDGIQQVLTEGSIVKESDTIQYFFDPTTIDPNSGFNAENYEDNINGESSIDIGDFTISGGTFNHLDGNPTFTQAGEITFDQAAGERGFGIDVLNGNGDRKELGLDEYMSIKFDNTYVSQFTLLVGSINGLFNSEAGHIEAYFYKDGVLLSSEGTPLEVTERVDGHIKEGDVFVENEEAFDEVRFVVVNDSNDGRGLDFVIQGVEDFNSAYPDGIEDSFTYTAIDTEGLESETATVTITNQDVDLDYEPVSNFIGLMQETESIYLGDFDEVAINQEDNSEESESSFSNMSISLTDILDMGEEDLDAYLSLAIRSEDLELTITDAPNVIETSNTDPSIEYQNTLIDSVGGLSSPSTEMFDDLLKTTVHDS